MAYCVVAAAVKFYSPYRHTARKIFLALLALHSFLNARYK